MLARVYVIAVSNPSAAGAAMMRHKQVPHRVVRVMPGLHPFLVRLAGFERPTVPALEIDGRKVQGSREISRYLDELVPNPPLFPTEPDARAAVVEAERWGERVLQPVPRRLFRFLMLTSEEARLWMAREVMHMPAARILQLAFMPVIGQLARVSRADEATVRRTIEQLPGLLERVDDLIAKGAIGGAEPNAADFQILSTVRALREFTDLARLVADRPCDAAARRLFPTWEGPVPASPALGKVS
jgi:glutathione S-transferase